MRRDSRLDEASGDLTVPQRVASLLPAATEIVAALGAGDMLVAVSDECDHPPEIMHLPRVTRSILDGADSSAGIDAAVRAALSKGSAVFLLGEVQLRELAPSLIITQSLCDVCAIGEGTVRHLAAVLDPVPRVLQLSGSTLDGVRDDIRAVGAALARVPEAEELLRYFDERFRHVHEALKAAKAPRPRIAVVEWLDPLFVAGHWVPELVRRAGGIDVLAEPGAHSATVSAGAIRAARPDLLIFAPCGFGLDRAARESADLLSTAAWAWAHDIETWALDGNALTSRPGPRLADAVETLAAIIAPGVFGIPAAAYARILLRP